MRARSLRRIIPFVWVTWLGVCSLSGQAGSFSPPARPPRDVPQEQARSQTASGVIRGRVITAETGEALPRAEVILESRAIEGRRSAGEYYAIALKKATRDEILNPELLEKWRDRGTPLTLADTEEQTLDLMVMET